MQSTMSLIPGILEVSSLNRVVLSPEWESVAWEDGIGDIRGELAAMGVVLSPEWESVAWEDGIGDSWIRGELAVMGDGEW